MEISGVIRSQDEWLSWLKKNTADYDYELEEDGFPVVVVQFNEYEFQPVSLNDFPLEDIEDFLRKKDDILIDNINELERRGLLQEGEAW